MELSSFKHLVVHAILKVCIRRAYTDCFYVKSNSMNEKIVSIIAEFF